MLIKSYIEAFLQSPKVYDKSHTLIGSEHLVQEFTFIRSYLAKNHDEGDSVALYLDNDYRYLLTMLACMDLGLTYIPLRIEWPEQRIEQIKALSSFSTLITDDYINKAVSQQLMSEKSFLIDSQKPLYYMFTSGSTGQPKGVVIKRESYENFLLWIDDYFCDITDKDRVLNSTDYTFDVSLVEVGIALVKRAGFYASNFSNDIFVLLNELHELRITAIATVPNNFIQILDTNFLSRADLSNLKHVLIAGARFPEKLYDLFLNKLSHANIYNCFGPTEATVYCLVKKFNRIRNECIDDGKVSIGRPILNLEAKILDLEDGYHCIEEAHTNGELIVGGVQVMDRYLNDKVNTEKAIIYIDSKKFYRTGDMVFKNDKGEFFVIGRTDDTIKVSGQRVNLSDIDAYVHTLDYVQDCATVDIPDVTRDKVLYLFVVLSQKQSIEKIQEDLKKILLSFQLPSKIVILDQLPVNNSGKISKKSLREDVLNGF